METTMPTNYPPLDGGARTQFTPGSFLRSARNDANQQAGGARKRPAKGLRLGTHMRGQFGELYTQRGSRMAYITVTYSVKADDDVGLLGRPAFLNYLSCEGDPDIVKVLYKLPPYLTKAGLTAVTITREHVLQLRVVRSTREDALRPVAHLERYADQFRERARQGPLAYHSVEVLPLSSADLVLGHEDHLMNWFELIPWVAQARFHGLERCERQFADMLGTHGQLSTAQIAGLAVAAEISYPLLMAAAIHGAAWGRWGSDFDRVPFGAGSQLTWGARP